MAKIKKIIDEVYTLDQVPAIARKLKELLPQNRIFAFKGSLGAGKTTLIKQLGKLLGIDEPLTSPTFTYMNQYEGSLERVYHFDLYRLNNAQEFLDAGFGEYLEQDGSIVFIEWPEVIETILGSYAQIYLEHYNENKRGIQVLVKKRDA